jgi:hypothetical protein
MAALVFIEKDLRDDECIDGSEPIGGEAANEGELDRGRKG